MGKHNQAPHISHNAAPSAAHEVPDPFTQLEQDTSLAQAHEAFNQAAGQLEDERRLDNETIPTPAEQIEHATSRVGDTLTEEQESTSGRHRAENGGFSVAELLAAQSTPVDANEVTATTSERTGEQAYTDKTAQRLNALAARLENGESIRDIAKSALRTIGRKAFTYMKQNSSDALKADLRTAKNIGNTIANSYLVQDIRTTFQQAKQNRDRRLQRKAALQTQAELARQIEAAREQDHEAAFKDASYMDQVHAEAFQDAGYMNQVHQEAFQDTGYMDTVHTEAFKDTGYMDRLHEEASAEYEEVLQQREAQRQKAYAARLRKARRLRAVLQAGERVSDTLSVAKTRSAAYGRALVKFAKSSGKVARGALKGAAEGARAALVDTPAERTPDIAPETAPAPETPKPAPAISVEPYMGPAQEFMAADANATPEQRRADISE